MFALDGGAHGWAVGGWARGAALLETDAAKGTEEARHVDPLLLWEGERGSEHQRKMLMQKKKKNNGSLDLFYSEVGVECI